MDRIVKWIWNLIEMIVRSSIKKIEIITKKSVQEQRIITFLQFVKFGVVGLSNSVVNYAVYAISLMTFREMDVFGKNDFVVAQILAFLISVLWAYTLNNKFVFITQNKKIRTIVRDLFRTYISYGFTGLVLSEILLCFEIKVVCISEWFAPLVNILICLPINFLLNKFWIFKEGEARDKRICS